ncbi:MAG: hypothetical protein R8M46_02930 [Ghiorsea sp.]
MSLSTHTKSRVLPPKPPLSIRLDKYVRYMAYSIPFNWKRRSIALCILCIALLAAWWTDQGRTPFLQDQRAAIVNPSVLQAEVLSLQAELDALSTEKSVATLQRVKKGIVQGYTGISKLLETAQNQAEQLELVFSYQLDQPKPSGFEYLANVSNLHITIRLIPQPSSSQVHIWNNMIRFTRAMVEHHQMMHLLGTHVSSNAKQIQELTLDLDLYVQLDHGHNGNTP